jgi:hypothetical protein
MSPESVQVLRLRVLAEADPAALQRVLEHFLHLNVLPRRVVAEYGTANTLHIQVDIAGVSEQRLSLIAAKIEQAPCVLRAFWTGAHAIALAVWIPALRERDARLGGTGKLDDSFPLTDAGNSARRRMFFAALTSRSCHSPQCSHIQRLTRNPLAP